MTNDELYHYGIKGMKWGIRKDKKTSNPASVKKTADPDTKRVILKKGSEVYRTTNVKEDHKGHAYVAINKKDAKSYEEWGDVHATYKALEDIVIPSKDERIKTAVDLIKNDDEVRMRMAKTMIGFTSGNYKRLANASLEKLAKRPYNSFVAGLADDKVIRDKYFQALTNKGYNAVEDVLDQGLMADMPIIIFDRSKTLSKAKYD